MAAVRVEYEEYNAGVIDYQRSSKYYVPPIPRKNESMIINDQEYIVYDVVHKPNCVERIMGQDSSLYVITVKIQRI